MHKNFKVLAINPGSTTTKIGLFSGETSLFEKNITHSVSDLKKYERTIDQYEFRLALISKAVEVSGLIWETLDAVVGRGGLLKPLESGTYRITPEMLHDLIERPAADHASNLGPGLAFHFARRLNIPAYTVDPVVVDEMDEVARLSGHPDMRRSSRLHALNMKAVARRISKQLGKIYSETTLVTAHLGSGFSIAIHHKGRMIDTTNAMDDGPFSVERAGELPLTQVVDFCWDHFRRGMSAEDVRRILTRESGVFGYLGTKDIRQAERRASEGDNLANLVLQALVYQVAKAIGAMATVVEGNVDGIIITGGVANSEYIASAIEKRVKSIAPVFIEPGEKELLALAQGALRVLCGEEVAKDYT